MNKVFKYKILNLIESIHISKFPTKILSTSIVSHTKTIKHVFPYHSKKIGDVKEVVIQVERTVKEVKEYTIIINDITKG